VHAEDAAGVFLLLDGPVAVFLINGVEVVVEVFVNFEVGNVKEGADGHHDLVDGVSEDSEGEEEPESEEEGNGNILRAVGSRLENA